MRIQCHVCMHSRQRSKAPTFWLCCLTVFPSMVWLYLIFLGGPEEEGKGALGQEVVNEPGMEEWEGALKDFHQLTFPDPPGSLRGRHLQWSCLHEKESLSPHGCTSLGTESVWEIVVQACANRCKEWFLGERKLSSFRLGTDMEFHCFVERTLIWRFLPAPHPINRTPHDMGRVCFSFFFFLLLFFLLLSSEN